VGAGHPVADNVSFWFYLKGWHGLVVEPQPELAGLYAHVRPRDHVAACVAGRDDGEMEFHAVEGLHGLSSTVRERAAGAGAFGAGYRTLRVPVRRLSALCDEAGLDRIDVLKVDVEGAEAEVLAGIDFTRHRPRVILLEAVQPGDLAEAWHGWEPALLANGYAFAYFDRLNRFYVASEDAGLADRFPKEPHGWDRAAHLWDAGRAGDAPGHPDHALARLLGDGLYALLPTLEPAFVAGLIRRGLEAGKREANDPAVRAELLGAAEFPRDAEPMPDLDALIASDQFRAALGRIACRYDGGHVD
jgi:FkbM family methyltransferase